MKAEPRDTKNTAGAIAIIEIADGEYAAFEIKLGSNQIEEAAKNLNKFYEVAEKKPKFMCIIVGHYEAVIQDP